MKKLYFHVKVLCKLYFLSFTGNCGMAVSLCMVFVSKYVRRQLCGILFWIVHTVPVTKATCLNKF